MFVVFPLPWAEQQPLQGWMTPGFVARMYDIPPHVLDPALQIGHAEGGKITLSEIATRQATSGLATPLAANTTGSPRWR